MIDSGVTFEEVFNAMYESLAPEDPQTEAEYDALYLGLQAEAREKRLKREALELTIHVIKTLSGHETKKD